MRRRAVIHAGLPKTGTTAIQNSLDANRDRLLSDAGVLYSAVDFNSSRALLMVFSEDPYPYLMPRMAYGLSKDQVLAKRSDLRQRIEAEISGASWDTLLFSAEGVSNLTEPSLFALREWARQYVDRIDLIAWVRHPIDQTRSVIQQLLRRGDRTLKDMYENPPVAQWRQNLSKLIDIFGREAVTVYTYEESRKAPGGMVGSFCRQIGLDGKLSTRLRSAATIDNKSLSMEAAMLLDSLNRQWPLIIDGKLNGERPLRALNVLRNLDGAPFDLPGEVKRAIVDLARPEIIWLQDTFGIDRYRDLLSDKIEIGDAPPLFTSEAVDSLARLIAGMMRRGKPA